MNTQCPHCHVEHRDLPGYEQFAFPVGLSRCPSCGAAVEIPGESRPASSNVAAVPAGAQPTLPAEGAECQAEYDRTETFSTSLTPPFRLSIHNVPQDFSAADISLEFRLANDSAEEIKGHISIISSETGVESPLPFSLPPANAQPLHEVQTESVVLKFPVTQGFSGHVTVRVRPQGCGDAFWQADHTLSRSKSEPVNIAVTVDKSVRAENVLEGIRSERSGDVFNISPGQPQPTDIWQDLRLRLRGPKELGDASDCHRPFFSGMTRPICKEREQDEVPLARTARLTLSRIQDDGKESLVQLLAGPAVNLGRAQTWMSDGHKQYQPNDIVLRTHAEDEEDDYISRYHGSIEFDQGTYSYTNFSQLGTRIGRQEITAIGQRLKLPSTCEIKPGASHARNPANSLGFTVRRSEMIVNASAYNLLARSNHLLSGMSIEHQTLQTASLTLTRNDGLRACEEYIILQQAVQLGSSPVCGWCIRDKSLQPVHARILWFDNSFWIEPKDTTCIVRIHGRPLAPNQVRRLTPDLHVELGGVRVLVLSSWKQHLIHCECCSGHDG